MRFWKKGRRGIYVYYYLWQIVAYVAARKLHKQFRFDVVHHVTFVKYAMPSFMVLLPVPFVWGPLGGGETVPRGFWRSFSFRGKVFEIFRTLARRLGEFDPFVRLTARRAALALCTTTETANRLERIGCRRVAVWSEAGLPPEDISQLHALPSKNHKPFRVVSSGNLLHWKGTQLGLQAFAALHETIPNSEYWIIGDGPERRRLQKLAEKLTVADSVAFWGDLPRQEVLEKLAACDVLMHPSIHDSGGWVCLEAMAAGRPVVCLDLGGPAFQVNDNTGIRVPACSPMQAVEDLAAALTLLARDPALCSKMGLAGQFRVSQHFNWQIKGTNMGKAYAAVINGDGSDIVSRLSLDA
jgi:glycosyltransferase involved in cell wall biosynthesis